MGDANQLAYVQRNVHRFAPPFLEVGARDYGSTQDVRALFRGRGDYVGVDLEGGAGVDLMLDLTANFAEVDAALGGRRFGGIFCLSVLEHCAQPFHMADNISRLLAPGGVVCVAVPFAWRFHGYPSDYWRFTHEGVRLLFANLDFDLDDAVLATERDGHTLPFDEEFGRIRFSVGSHRRDGHPLRGLTAGALRLLARLGPLRWLAGYRYVLPPTNVLMIGQRPTT